MTAPETMKSIQWRRGITRLYVVTAICWVVFVIALATMDASSWPKAPAHDLGVAPDFDNRRPVVHLSSGFTIDTRGQKVDCYDKTGSRVSDKEPWVLAGGDCGGDEYEVPHGHRFALPSRWERWHDDEIRGYAAFAVLPVVLVFALMRSVFWALAGFRSAS